LKKDRIQLDVTQPMTELLERLTEETGATTRSEVIRRAISIYAVLVDEQKNGCKIELAAPDGKVMRVLLTP